MLTSVCLLTRCDILGLELAPYLDEGTWRRLCTDSVSLKSDGTPNDVARDLWSCAICTLPYPLSKSLMRYL